jgi:hypothetical protein
MSEQASAVSSAVDIKTKVAQAIAERSPSVRQQVVELMANEEIERRKMLVYNAVKDREKLEKEVAKIKPDHETFDLEGKSVKVFSKEKFEEMRKAKEKLAKLDAALDEALGDPPKYDKLNNLAGNKKEEKPQETEA